MTFDTKKHLVSLKGKDYLEVKWRLVWFRDEWPHGVVESQHIEIGENHAIFRATVTKVDDKGTVLGSATDYGSETSTDFGDFIEKASTKAIGRALAALGYGTQHAPELDEGERVVDSPVRAADRSALTARGELRQVVDTPQRRPQAVQRPQDSPRLAPVAQDTKNSDGARQAANRRVHALLEHPTVSAAVRVKFGLESTAEASAEQLNVIADLEEGKADRDAVQRWHAWKHQRASAQAAKSELLPGVDVLPNPDPARFTR